MIQCGEIYFISDFFGIRFIKIDKLEGSDIFYSQSFSILRLLKSTKIVNLKNKVKYFERLLSNHIIYNNVYKGMILLPHSIINFINDGILNEEIKHFPFIEYKIEKEKQIFDIIIHMPTKSKLRNWKLSNII